MQGLLDSDGQRVRVRQSVHSSARQRIHPNGQVQGETGHADAQSNDHSVTKLDHSEPNDFKLSSIFSQNRQKVMLKLDEQELRDRLQDEAFMSDILTNDLYK